MNASEYNIATSITGEATVIVKTDTIDFILDQRCEENIPQPFLHNVPRLFDTYSELLLGVSHALFDKLSY